MISTCLTCGHVYRMRSPTDFRDCQCTRDLQQMMRAQQEPDTTETQKVRGQKAQLLRLLRECGEVSNVQLKDNYILNHTARISELRDAGFRVEKRKGDGNVWWYRLVP